MKKTIIFISFIFLFSCSDKKEKSKDLFYIEKNIIHTDNNCNENQKTIIKRADFYGNYYYLDCGFINRYERKFYYPCSKCININTLNYMKGKCIGRN